MKYFYKDIELDVPKGVYYPREDSELMAEVLQEMDVAGQKTLEIGCGSGFLSILMAKKGATVTAADVDSAALEVARLNAGRNNARTNFLRSDLFSGIHGVFDLIVFNPPYLPAEETDLTYSGGPTGRSVIEKFMQQAKKHLADRGCILLLISSLTGEKEVIQTINECSMKAEAVARQKAPWEELTVLRITL